MPHLLSLPHPPNFVTANAVTSRSFLFRKEREDRSSSEKGAVNVERKGEVLESQYRCWES